MLMTAKYDNVEISADTFGAELHSIKLNGREYLWQCGEAWKRYAPVLFPFICSPMNKKYKADGVEYTMPANHGFARDSEFLLGECTSNSVSFELASSDETLKVYPYDFKLTVKYLCNNNQVVVTDTVENTGDKPMYLYIGGHPAFNCPLEDGLKFDDYKIVYSENETIHQPLPNGKSRTIISEQNSYALSRELFDYDVIMQDNPVSKAVTLCSDKSKYSVTVKYPQSDCIAVWSPTGDENATFVCLEPWTSVPVYCDDEFEDIEKKPHAIKLEAGKKFIYGYIIEVN